jgi:hypothetical protein
LKSYSKNKEEEEEEEEEDDVNENKIYLAYANDAESIIIFEMCVHY